MQKFLQNEDIKRCSVLQNPSFLADYKVWKNLEDQKNFFKKDKIQRFLLARKQQSQKEISMYSNLQQQCILQVCSDLVIIRSYPGFEKLMVYNIEKRDEIVIKVAQNKIKTVKGIVVSIYQKTNEQTTLETLKKVSNSINKSEKPEQQIKIHILKFFWSDQSKLQKLFQQFKPVFISNLSHLIDSILKHLHLNLSLSFIITDNAFQAQKYITENLNKKLQQCENFLTKLNRVKITVQIQLERCRYRSDLLKLMLICKQTQTKQLTNQQEKLNHFLKQLRNSFLI